jgi:hypothetical protein
MRCGLAILLSALLHTGAAAAQCQLCAPEQDLSLSTSESPLSIEIETMLDFDRVALAGSGGGAVAIDPQTGRRSTAGELVAAGGVGIQGTALVRGEPGRAILLHLPRSTTLHSSSGDSAELTDLVADLPPGARLGPNGMLRFSFGGRLIVKGNADGDYRGRILLTVDYQ